MTVLDVLKKMDPSQRVRIEDEVRGKVSGSAYAMYEMLSGVMMSLGVAVIRAEGVVVVLEVEQE